MDVSVDAFDVEVKTEIRENTNESIEVQTNDFVAPSTKELQYITQCVWCQLSMRPNDNPKLLECLHAACNQCLDQKLSESILPNANVQPHTVECALCQMPSMLGQIIDNHFVLELTEESLLNNEETDIKCSSCTEDAPASSWCVECAEYICLNCVLAHQRLKITKDHTIKPKDEVTSEYQKSGMFQNAPKLYCTLHPQEKLSLFCETCDKLTCRDCQLAGHRDHKYKFSHEIADEARSFIHSLLDEVSYKRVLLSSAMKVIDERQAMILDKKKSLVQEITQMVVRLTNTINTRGKQLVHRLSEVCESKQKTLSEKKLALEQLSNHTDHCIEFVNSALDKCSDAAVLYSKRHVTNHLQKIKCRRADIPNPEIPVRIHLALEKLPDLIKVVQSIGSIVVDGKVYSPNSVQHLQQVAPPQPMNQNQQQPLQGQTQIQQQNSLLRPLSTPSPSSQQQFRIAPPPGPQQQYMPPTYSSHHNINPGPHHHINPAAIGPPQRRGLLPIGMIRGQTPNLLRHAQSIVRNQQVSSSTHPQNIDVSLRGLLNTPVQQMQAQSPSSLQCTDYNNMVRASANPLPLYAPRSTAFSGGTYTPQNMYLGKNFNRPINPNANIRNMAQQQPYLQQYQQQQPMQHLHNQQINQQPITQNITQPVVNNQMTPLHKWHIPQNMNNLNGTTPNGRPSLLNGHGSSEPPVNHVNHDNFKITIKQPSLKSGSTVTSTNPKTPSPTTLQGSKDSENIDNFCQASVNDLMATIAKLDSNGVQVMPEGQNEKGSSPQVHSSTDEPPIQTTNVVAADNKDDPNEDWCAVCMDGGELMCCDKCPKVFHQNCHIPSLSSLPDESELWQCMLCFNFADLPSDEQSNTNELTDRLRKIVQRLLLELYCQYEPSLPFRELVSVENTDYYAKVKDPVALSTIKAKLDRNHPQAYSSVEYFIKDVKLMFSNAYLYNDVEDVVYKNAVTLEEFFDQQVQKYLPAVRDKILHLREDDDDCPIPLKRIRRQLSDD